jgi:2-keto-4-pentenoate hydratase/2-oxohepta-3-ene-1,7-dioic acid hydratase in catechol pathway
VISYYTTAAKLLLSIGPQGVGMGRKPQCWLKDGDIVEVGIEGIGSITNNVTFERMKAQL